MPDEVKPQEPAISIVERAEKIHKETLEAEKRIAEHRAKIEELTTRNIMSGQATSVPLPPVKVETPKEYKDRILRGG